VHLALPEAAYYHAPTLESRPDDYTQNVRLRIEMGRYILAEDYVRALRGRDALTADVDKALEGRDALFLPTMPTVATKLGAATVSIDGTEEPVRNVMLRLTQIFNITGHAAISMPCGHNSEGLPVGVQAVCRHTSDVLPIASALEPVLER
jgi:aspartyl-tRNA(Asn)/glutamyl-tRNA(Gln) amidotransferase subunit A